MTLAQTVERLSMRGYQRRFRGVVVCDGNSLTAGTGGFPNTYPAQLAAALPDCLVINCGIGAQSTSDMIAASSDVDKYLVGGTTRQIVIAWELRNQIHSLGATPVEAVDAMEQYCLARRALGARVIVMNTTPSDLPTDSFSDADQVEVNAELLSRWPAFASAMVDLAAIPELQDPQNTTYFSDLIHLTAAGYGKVKDAAFLAVSNLL